MKRLMRLLVVCSAAAGLVLGLSSSVEAGGKMYWTDSTTDKIQRANLDGSNVQDLVTGLAAPQFIDLDVAGGKMYWVDPGTRKIQRADLDGSNVEDLVTKPANSFFIGIALDVTGGKMYWTDPGNFPLTLIQRANLEIPTGETASTRTDIEDLVGGAANSPWHRSRCGCREDVLD